DVESAIKHLFKLQISDFFMSKNVIADHFYIQQECRRMQRHFADAEITDFTQQLQENVSYIFDTKTADIANLNTETPEFKKVIRPISEPIKVTLKG
ncbi:cellulose biosynthesis protein BcsE, partial [Pseudoalteromonas shioyasakiensis]|nr:cellulose biosynthesis protein BcsE [Pseudoalteromonas shioyasakiensis]